MMQEEVNRNKMIVIPVSEEEKRLAEYEADKIGMPVTAFFRLMLKNWVNGITFEKKG
jgi:hypothetical protein